MSETKENSSRLPASPTGGGGEAVEGQVRRIHDKLQLMLKQRESLLKENEKLKGEIRQLQLHHTEHLARLEQLHQQVEILRVSKGDMKEEEKKAFEKRLSQYIREIDRCIALLGE